MNKDIQIAQKTVQTEIKALKKLAANFKKSQQFTKAVIRHARQLIYLVRLLPSCRQHETRNPHDAFLL